MSAVGGNKTVALVMANANQDETQKKKQMLGIVGTMRVDECADAITKTTSQLEDPIFALLRGAVLHPKNREVFEKMALKGGYTVAFAHKMINLYAKAMGLPPIVRSQKQFSNTLDEVVNERVIGFLGDADLKSLGCSNKLYRNLIVAYRGMNYVRAQKLIVDNQTHFKGQGVQTRVEAMLQTEQMRGEADSVIFDSTHTIKHSWHASEMDSEANKAFREVLITSACSLHWKYGRCTEMAAIAIANIRKFRCQNVFLSEYTIGRRNDGDFGHVAFVVGDMAQGAQSAVLGDAWAGRVCVYKHREYYVQNYLGYYESLNKTILTPFDGELDQEHIEVVCEPATPKLKSPPGAPMIAR